MSLARFENMTDAECKCKCHFGGAVSCPSCKELTQDLNDVRDHVKIKDEEILRLRHEIANLNTMVQIETLKSELANLKSMAGNYYKK